MELTWWGYWAGFAEDFAELSSNPSSSDYSDAELEREYLVESSEDYGDLGESSSDDLVASPVTPFELPQEPPFELPQELVEPTATQIALEEREAFEALRMWFESRWAVRAAARMVE